MILCRFIFYCIVCFVRSEVYGSQNYVDGTSYFGQGAIQEIVNEIKNRHFKKALVTSTPDLFEFKVATKVTDLLDAAGIDYEIYDGIKPNPTIENVTAGV